MLRPPHDRLQSALDLIWPSVWAEENTSCSEYPTLIELQSRYTVPSGHLMYHVIDPDPLCGNEGRQDHP